MKEIIINDMIYFKLFFFMKPKMNLISVFLNLLVLKPHFFRAAKLKMCLISLMNLFIILMKDLH